MRGVLLQAARLLELAKPFDLNWSPIEHRVVNYLLTENCTLKREHITKLLKISDARLGQLIREVVNRLNLFAKAVQSGTFDQQDVRTWPIVLLKLDDSRRYGRHLEKRLFARQITMVAQLLGPESRLAKAEFRKGLGRCTFDKLEEKLKPYGLLDELAWKAPVPDSRRMLQDQIERQIRELNLRAVDQRTDTLRPRRKIGAEKRTQHFGLQSLTHDGK